MNDTIKGSRSNRPTDPAPGTRKDRSLKEGPLGLFSAAAFVPLFHLPLPAFAMVVRVLILNHNTPASGRP